MELQGKKFKSLLDTHQSLHFILYTHTDYNAEKIMQLYLVGILKEEREENKQQADESAKQIKLLEGTSVCFWTTKFFLSVLV